MEYQIKRTALVALIFLLFNQLAHAQEKKVATGPAQLVSEIAVQDSLLFAAFNAQDLSRMKSFFSADLEWYQDNGGLMGFDTVFRNFENNFYVNHLDLKRTLVANSMEVYPIKNYGAIETATHQFRHMENGQEQIGTFKFLAIWKKTADHHWQITKMVSYGH